jgi:hypothetical protein
MIFLGRHNKRRQRHTSKVRTLSLPGSGFSHLFLVRDDLPSVNGIASSMAVHINGYARVPGCQHASNEAVAAAKAYKIAENLKKTASSISDTSMTHPSTTKRPASPGPAPMTRALKHQAKLSVVLKQYANFLKEEIAKIEKQALRAIISANLPYSVFDDLEVIKLMEML